MKKFSRIIFVTTIVIGLGIVFLAFFGLPEYRTATENEERMRIRKEELARNNPELLARIENAIEELEQKVREDPNDSRNWFELGTNKKNIGDYVGAEVALKKAIQLDSISLNAPSNLGTLYQDIGEYVKAEEMFREMVERQPNLPDGYIRLAELYRPGTYKSKQEEEKVLLEGIAATQEENPLLLLTLAEYYDRAKLFSQALAAYKKVLALNPPNKALIEEEIERLESLQ